MSQISSESSSVSNQVSTTLNQSADQQTILTTNVDQQATSTTNASSVPDITLQEIGLLLGGFLGTMSALDSSCLNCYLGIGSYGFNSNYGYYTPYYGFEGDDYTYYEGQYM